MCRPDLAVIALMLAASPAALSGDSKQASGTIELRSDREVYSGRVMRRTDRECLLVDRTGRLVEVELAKVKSFRQISPKFTPLSTVQVSGQLLRELGPDYETATTRHYIVAAPKGRARQYVDLFEEVYRTFHMHFTVRGFNLDEPEFPLVAIVFSDHSAFADYARSENTRLTSGTAGYYQHASNRIALFESGEARPPTRGTASKSLRLEPGEPSDPLRRLLSATSPSIEADLEGTMIHEATHQVAFNVGLHNRLGDNPTWVVEGLATVFEAPGIRSSSDGRQIANRINHDRHRWFKEYMKSRRKPNSVESFISGDDLFQSAALDAYAEAWALSFYLIETRPRQYVQYLKRIASREDVAPLSSEERIEAFKTTFGQNLRQFDAELVRFYERLK